MQTSINLMETYFQITIIDNDFNINGVLFMVMLLLLNQVYLVTNIINHKDTNPFIASGNNNIFLINIY